MQIRVQRLVWHLADEWWLWWFAVRCKFQMPTNWIYLRLEIWLQFTKKVNEIYTQAFSRYIEINSQIIGKLKIKGIPVKVSFTIGLWVGVEEGKWEKEIDKFWIWLWSSAMYPIDRSIVALFYAWIVGQFIIRAADYQLLLLLLFSPQLVCLFWGCLSGWRKMYLIEIVGLDLAGLICWNRRGAVLDEEFNQAVD